MEVEVSTAVSIPTILKAPFPWFGGKSRVARQVWERFGDVPNYVEPFAGSLAVLLGRESAPRVETVNDIDCWISNFWRALQADPDGVATAADWPVNEADLHARHLWLVNQLAFREQVKTDPDFFDCSPALSVSRCERRKVVQGSHSRTVSRNRVCRMADGRAD